MYIVFKTYFLPQIQGKPEINSIAQEYINKLKPEDSLCIVGTHYFGELISKVFKIYFDNL